MTNFTKAHRIDDLAKAGPFARSKLYMLIRDGRLVARKIDGVSFVLESDWKAFLESAPVSQSTPFESSLQKLGAAVSENAERYTRIGHSIKAD